MKFSTTLAVSVFSVLVLCVVGAVYAAVCTHCFPQEYRRDPCYGQNNSGTARQWAEDKQQDMDDYLEELPQRDAMWMDDLMIAASNISLGCGLPTCPECNTNQANFDAAVANYEFICLMGTYIAAHATTFDVYQMAISFWDNGGEWCVVGCYYDNKQSDVGDPVNGTTSSALDCWEKIGTYVFYLEEAVSDFEEQVLSIGICPGLNDEPDDI